MLGDKILIKPEYFALANEIVSLLENESFMKAGQRCVIGIGGESGSGKSVTAKCLGATLNERGPGAYILHQDDYFVLPPLKNHINRKANLKNVGMHEVNLARLQDHVNGFLAGEDTISAPLVDFDRDTITDRSVSFGSAGVLIVEGTYALSLQNLDARIFLSRNYKDTRHLRAMRNRDTHVEANFIDQILEIEHQIIRRFAETASLIVDKSYQLKKPATRQSRTGLT